MECPCNILERVPNQFDGASEGALAKEKRSSTEGEEPDEIELARDADDDQPFPEDDFNFQPDEEAMEDALPEEEEAALPGEEPSAILSPSIADTSGHGSYLADAGAFELGAVNDIEADANYDEDGQRAEAAFGDNAEGDDNERSGGHWHPHTKKVMAMLESQFETKDEVSYNNVSGVDRGNKVGRRTAAGVFFEMLQLKTWDYVELGQQSAYGDIVVTKGNRFDEGAPQ